eukprot:GFYU01003903.1.p1 GENE.GFYU01003903.1~~GFYU01003903.1.p1  ORF type:complete len:170 (+),score=27.88 GFYU01003903.1:156-665(+)
MGRYIATEQGSDVGRFLSDDEFCQESSCCHWWTRAFDIHSPNVSRFPQWAPAKERFESEFLPKANKILADYRESNPMPFDKGMIAKLGIEQKRNLHMRKYQRELNNKWLSEVNAFLGEHDLHCGVWTDLTQSQHGYCHYLMIMIFNGLPTQYTVAGIVSGDHDQEMTQC